MTVPIAEINTDALRHNLAVVKQCAPHSKILAMLKANAYGHGLVRAAKALYDADAFAVARLDEAMQLRKAGVTKPVVVMMGFVNALELALMSEHDVQAVIHSDYQIDYLYNTPIPKPITAWLKIETGLGRLGFVEDEAMRAYERLMACEQVNKPLFIMSHLACAEMLENPKTMNQLERFQKLTAGLEGPRSIAKSAAIMENAKTHLDWVRPGVMLFGVSPFKNEIGADRGLQPVMRVRSELVSVKWIAAGETIGYGETWHCEEDMPIGVVGFGYADGYPRHITPGAPVLIHGVRCQVIGRISMDMMMIDLRPCSDAKVGDTVVLWGPELPVEIIARHANTIAYTLLVGLTQRVRFIEV